MKKLIFVIFIVFVGQWASSQESNDLEVHEYHYKNALKLSPIELGRAEFQASYERYFQNRKTSIVTLLSLISGNRGVETRQGIQVFLQYRFYLSHLQKSTHQTLNMYNIGFYSAPYLLGLIHEENYEFGVYDPVLGEYNTSLVNEKIRSAEAGALMGLQLDITQRIVLDFFVGGGIRMSDIEKVPVTEGDFNYGLLELGYSGVKPRVGLQIGITF